MKTQLQVRVAAASVDLHDRLFHRVRAGAEMVQRIDDRTSVWAVPANRFEWFAGHCLDLGVDARDDSAATA